MGAEVGAQAARSRALAVLRIRSRASAVALLPAAVAVVLLAAGVTGRATGGSWDLVRWVVTAVAVLTLIAAAGVALVVARARPAVSPTVAIAERSAPDLYRLVRDLADRLDVPVPSAIALTPDCDSWLEDRTHPAHAQAGADRGSRSISRRMQGLRGASGAADAARRAPTAPVLVIGSPFLWWMRVAELRAVLAPVVAGTGPSAHPDIAAARRFVRGLDAAAAVGSDPGRGPVARLVLGGVGRVARVLLRSCREHAAEMERGVATAGSERAQEVDYGLRIVAQEQVGLAYAGWDRLLTRVALPAWRMGRWPSRLDAGVVAALTELSRRDRLAEGFASRLGERPACDLLEEPGTVDEATSLLAARLFHGGPAGQGPDWAPVDWQEYPDEVVDRKWRQDAARLHRVLDGLGVRRAPDSAVAHPEGPTLSRVLDHLDVAGTGAPRPDGDGQVRPGTTGSGTGPAAATSTAGAGLGAEAAPAAVDAGATLTEEELAAASDQDLAARTGIDIGPDRGDGAGAGSVAQGSERSEALAGSLSAELSREEAEAPEVRPVAPGQGPDEALWGGGELPIFPLQPPRTGRELLADHVTAMVCCAAMDTAGATPGLDWLDGPSLLVGGERTADLGPRVLSLVEDGNAAPLRDWLSRLGVRAEKPVRLI